MSFTLQPSKCWVRDEVSNLRQSVWLWAAWSGLSYISHGVETEKYGMMLECWLAGEYVDKIVVSKQFYYFCTIYFKRTHRGRMDTLSAFYKQTCLV